ncbi:hypothetical protein BV22DRAFT_1034043 [Leucogyrophana mollusca]|uniref:Uncharacterized protein n=1 Tax=Leucogyrophana mollusca TaxID=85980 RepID=A0ACB8BI24_9AGAM|nr:hypothetical protein BV22DRAFT_1034043 [Leucogyrophana mollusca]
MLAHPLTPPIRLFVCPPMPLATYFLQRTVDTFTFHVDTCATIQLFTADPRVTIHISPMNHAQFLNLSPPNPTPKDGAP